MNARILVADDSVTIQKVVELTFSKEDFLLIQARSGEEAIKKAKEERPDLILLDLVMPDKNGYEVCEALRAEPTLQGVPIVLLAGSFEGIDRERSAQAGANDVVSKPFESQVLIGKVKQLLFQRTLNIKPSAAPAQAASRPAPTPPVAVPIPSVAPMPPIAPAPLAAAPAAAASVPPITSVPSVAPAPPAPAVTSAAAAAPPEPSGQDRLWELLESGPAAPAVPAPGAAPVGPPPEPPLDLSLLEQAPLDLTLLSEEAPPARPGSEADMLPLPESLSLDDLLLPPGAQPAPEVPVFELPADEALPSLSLVPAEAEPAPLALETEPPALVLEAPVEAATPAAGEAGLAALSELSLEIPELDAAPLQEVTALTGPDVAAAEPAAAPIAEEMLSLPEMHLADKLPGLDLPELTIPELSLPTTLEPAMAPEPAAALEPEPAVAEAPPAPVDMGAMRQAVTERVAEALARELSQKLVERIERVVWEVVPDLAEVLIAKEIERIRLLAEESQKSA